MESVRRVYRPRDPSGKVFGRYGILKVGIGLEGEERHVKVFGVGNWYKKDDISGMPPLSREAQKDPGR